MRTEEPAKPASEVADVGAGAAVAATQEAAAALSESAEEAGKIDHGGEALHSAVDEGSTTETTSKQLLKEGNTSTLATTISSVGPGAMLDLANDAPGGHPRWDKRFNKMTTDEGAPVDPPPPESAVVKHGSWSRTKGSWNMQYSGMHGWEGGTSTCGEIGEVIGGRTSENGRSTAPTRLKRKFVMPSGSDNRISLSIVPMGRWVNAVATVAVNGVPCWSTTFDGRQECTKEGEEAKGPMVQATATCDAHVEKTALLVEVYATSAPDEFGRHDEFAEPFAVRDVKVLSWQVPCSSSICGNVAMLKEPAPMCQGECTMAFCCDAAPMCSEDVCPPEFMYKLQPVKYCANGGCAVSDCCDERAKCSNSICKPTEGHVRKKEFPPFCKQTTCEAEECCDELPRCSPEVCGSVFGKIPTREPPKFCARRRCSVVECCESAPKCDPTTTKELCDANQGLAPRANLQQSLHCESYVCKKEECCMQLPTCSADVCPTNAALKASKQSEFCTKNPCPWEDCCEKLPTCDETICKPAALKTHPPPHCQAMECTKAECCDDDEGGLMSMLKSPLSLTQLESGTPRHTVTLFLSAAWLVLPLCLL